MKPLRRLNNWILPVTLLLAALFVSPARAQVAVGGSGSNTTDSSSYTGTNGLTKSGSNTVTLSGNNSYTGTTTISAGVLQVGSGGTTGSLGSGTIQLDGGTLRFNRSDNVTVGNVFGSILLVAGGVIENNGTGLLQINNVGDPVIRFGNDSGLSLGGTGTSVLHNGLAPGAASSFLKKNGNGTWILTSDSNNYSGATTISGGTLQVGNGGTTGKIGSGAVTNNGVLAFNRSNAISVANAISGNGSLVQSGTGTTTLTADNTYTGGTTVNSGILRIGANSVTGSVGGALTTNATLIFDRSNSLSVSQAISGTGEVKKWGTGTTTFTGANVFSGNFTHNYGVSVLNRAGGPALYADGSTGNVNISNLLGGANGFYGAVETLAANQLGSNVNVTFDPQNIASAYSYLVLKGNNQTIGNLSSPNSYASAWGIVENQETGSFGNSRLTVTQTQNGTFKGEFRNGYGTSVGSLGLTKDGSATLTLTSAGGAGISYTGTTIINAGTLKLADATGFASATTINAGGTLELANTGAQTISATISGAGSLVKSAAGTATLSAQNTYTGGTTINAGTLSLGANNILSDSTTVTVNSGGTLNLGSFGDYIGALVMNGNATVAGTSGLGGGQFLLTQGLAGSPTTKTLTATGTNNTIATNIGISSQWGGVGNNANLQFNVVGASDTLSIGGVIANLAFDGGGNATTGSVTKTGAGTLTLTGNNTFTGGTTVNAGTLAIGSGGAFANNAANSLIINNGGTVTIARADFLGNHSSTINMPIVVNAGGMLQNSGAVFNTLGALTLSGGTLQANAVETTSGFSFALKGAVTVNGSTTSTIAGNGFTLGAAGVTGTTFNVNDGAAATDLNVTGVLSDGAGNTWPTKQASSLTKNGTGKMVLAGDNTFTGTTTINSGTLALDKASGAQLYKTGAHLPLENAITVNTGATFQSWNWSYGANNALSMLQDNYTAFVLNGGKVVVDDTFASTRGFTVGANGATLETTAGNTYTKSANSNEYNLIRFTANSTLAVGGEGNTVINDALGSFGNTGFSITKNGTGTLTLGGSNSYTGATTISEGTLQVGNGGTAGTLGSANVTNNGTLAVNRSNAFALSNLISGTGSLVHNGSGTTTLTGANSYSGGTVINAGTLLAGSANRLADTGAVTVNAGALDLGGYSDTVGAVTLAGGSITNGTLTGNSYSVQSGSISAVLAGTGSLTKSGTGTVTLSGANIYAGGTTVSAGKLAGTTTAIQGAVVNNAAVEFDQSTNGTYAGAMSGTGSLTKSGAGTVTLSGTNSYAGGTTVSAGKLAGTTTAIQGAVVNNAAVEFNQSTNGTYAGAMSGTGSLTKSGTGTVTLGGNNSYSAAPRFRQAHCLAQLRRSKARSPTMQRSNSTSRPVELTAEA